MLRLDEQVFAWLDSPATLGRALQAALELEHATIPPYLVAGYSLKAANRTIKEWIFDVALEEMLHMMLVANIMNAIGVPPRLNHSGFIPIYPGPLPGSVHEGLEVGLEPFSIPLLEKAFLAIEEPETIIDYPVVTAAEGELAPSRTIGEFYRRLRSLIDQGGSALFAHPANPQITINVSDDLAIEVTDPESAKRAIDCIVEQGEGTRATPFRADTAAGTPADAKHLAHYYRFLQIVKGRTLRRDPSVDEGYSYGEPNVTFDPAGVWPVQQNLRIAQIPPDHPVRPLVEEFSRNYTAMLGQLHDGFNGQPARIDEAVSAMKYKLGASAQRLVRSEIASGVNAGPTFEYVV